MAASTKTYVAPISTDIGQPKWGVVNATTNSPTQQATRMLRKRTRHSSRLLTRGAMLLRGTSTLPPPRGPLFLRFHLDHLPRRDLHAGRSLHVPDGLLKLVLRMPHGFLSQVQRV